MKVAVTAIGTDLDSQVSPSFGRAPYFIIAEIEGGKITNFEAIRNSGSTEAHGAGIIAAQTAAEKANAIISGNIGPKSFEVLKRLGIPVYKGDGSVKEALQAFIEGRLERIL
jgi:predicted Fe-Mo cluster-binding NifX family protein